MPALPSPKICQIHTVCPGDNLESIAWHYYGKKEYWSYIWKYNVDIYFFKQAPMCMVTPCFIIPGMNIYIPPSEAMQEMFSIENDTWETKLEHTFAATQTKKNSIDPLFEQINRRQCMQDPKQTSLLPFMHNKETLEVKPKEIQKKQNNTTQIQDFSGGQTNKEFRLPVKPIYTIDLAGVEHKSPPVFNGLVTVEAKYKFNRGKLTQQQEGPLQFGGEQNFLDSSYALSLKQDYDEALGGLLSSVKLSYNGDSLEGEMEIKDFVITTSKDDPLRIGAKNEFKTNVGRNELTFRTKLSMGLTTMTPFGPQTSFKGEYALSSKINGKQRHKKNKYIVSIEDVGLELTFLVTFHNNYPHPLPVQVPVYLPSKYIKFTALVDEGWCKSRQNCYNIKEQLRGNEYLTWYGGISLDKMFEILRNGYSAINNALIEDATTTKQNDIIPTTIFLAASNEIDNHPVYNFSISDWTVTALLVAVVAVPVVIIVAGGGVLPAAAAAAVTIGVTLLEAPSTTGGTL